MHPYSINNSDKNKAYAISLILCIFSGWLISNAIGQIPKINQYLWIIDVPSAFVLFGIFFKLFDLFIWRLLVKVNFIFQTPDMNGTYEGTLVSSSDGINHPIKITVKQSLTDIRIYLKSDATSSKSEIAGILNDDEENPILLYEYININTSVIKGNLPMHRGLTRLRFDKDEKTLLGDYFTSSERKNFGEINVRQISQPS